MGFWQDALHRFRRDRVGMVCLFVLLAFAIIAIFPGLFSPADPRTVDPANRLAPPGDGYLLGSDQLGRDILSRLVWGARYSLGISALAVLLGLTVGSTIGLIAGFFPKLDNILMRCIDVLQAFPFILRALAIVAILGPGLRNAIIAIGLGSIPSLARLVRSMVIQVREEPYVEAALALGARSPRILIHHIFPQTVGFLIVYATFEFGRSIIGLAVLGFLNLGVTPPTPEWGAMSGAGRQFLRIAPHISLMPVAPIFVVGWASNLLGDSLRDVLDPKLKR